MPQMLVSFGFKYGGPNSAEGRVIDIRRWFNRNPERLKHIRHLRGTDPEIQADVLQTPGFEASYCALLREVATDPSEIVFLGCTAGHHRSVFIVEKMGQQLGIPVLHRDIERK